MEQACATQMSLICCCRIFRFSNQRTKRRYVLWPIELFVSTSNEKWFTMNGRETRRDEKARDEERSELHFCVESLGMFLCVYVVYILNVSGHRICEGASVKKSVHFTWMTYSFSAWMFCRSANIVLSHRCLPTRTFSTQYNVQCIQRAYRYLRRLYITLYNVQSTHCTTVQWISFHFFFLSFFSTTYIFDHVHCLRFACECMCLCVECGDDTLEEQEWTLRSLSTWL